MVFDISLKWPSFNVDVNTVDVWMKANAGESYRGLSSNSMLVAHFVQDPGEDVASEIDAYWSALEDSSPEAVNYASKDDREASAAAEKAAKVASATAKLETLGLTADEISAILGS